MLSLLALTLGATTVLAQGSKGGEGHVGGSFEDGGETQVSAMMLFLGNENTVYILDKSEGNAATINGHPAMGSVYDIASRTATPIEVSSNPFCASGSHMPNGSFIAFGGNGAIGPTGNVGDTGNGQYDTTYGDLAGQTSVRVMNPNGCEGSDAVSGANCQWYDNPAVTHLQAMRWYSTAEALGDGTVAVIGGYSNGGYINRNYPEQTDPVWQGGASQPTYEFWPPKEGWTPPVMQFLVDAGGLNSYPLTYLLASGKMVMQANVSTMLWDPSSGNETPLPPMPDNLVRVYPASGANAMLPLTPANNYSQTVLFCGGNDMPDNAWGNYSWPFINTWDYPASSKCHRIEPEPADGSAPAYVEDDPMPEGRTMGQFIHLPDGTMLVVNGGLNGTAGYSTQTLETLSYSDMPYGMSLASGPVGRPAIFDARKPAGQRWSSDGLATSNIPRLYHSSALLLPDASVLIAGGNPNVDVNLTTVFPTTYKAERFYPPYFSAAVRPSPQNVPKTISYGGPSFDITVPAASYSGSANDAADNSTVVIIRPGFTTHAMNMGQRYMQLNNTYTVNSDGSITLHVAQAPPNPNLFQPGPALLFVTVNGIPSNGTLVTVGNGQIGTQPTAAIAELPASVRLDSAKGTGAGSSTGGSNSTTTTNQSSGASHTGPIVGGIIAAIALVGILG
ncbi:glyoxal oxidase N terminal domain-containing protein [Phanerochaete sordida]|uniref:Glyoxal oxidase N terminal domain-containing protein n=1 Tax=Phanerochaete sordida TaxID=48140 RepID=A0A9P3GAB1_9APHY|nr:glyoxal oxidase N terminal domain-containing protein [Phanerochaete sordida]